MGRRKHKTSSCPFCCCFCCQEAMDKIRGIFCCCSDKKDETEGDRLIQNPDHSDYGSHLLQEDDKKKSVTIKIDAAPEIEVLPVHRPLPDPQVVETDETHAEHVHDHNVHKEKEPALTHDDTHEHKEPEHETDEKVLAEACSHEPGHHEQHHHDNLATPPPETNLDRAESATYSRLSMSTTSPELIASDSDGGGHDTKHHHRSPYEQSPRRGSKLPDVDAVLTYRMVLLGRVGSGKSSLISGLAQYNNWPDFEVARNQMIQLCVPIEFRRGEAVLTKGIDDDNERHTGPGQTRTQKPKVHSFKLDSDYLDILDTPGLDDSRGTEQDSHAINSILTEVEAFGDVHAIVVVLDAHNSDEELKLTAQRIFSNFPKTVLDNVFFVLTHCSDQDGHVFDRITHLLEDIGIQYHLNDSNTFFVNNEGLAHLIFRQENAHEFESQEKEDEAARLWEMSAQNVKQLYDSLKRRVPVQNKAISDYYHYVKETNSLLKKYSEHEAQFQPEERDRVLLKLGQLAKVLTTRAILIDTDNQLIKDLLEKASAVDGQVEDDGVYSLIQNIKSHFQDPDISDAEN